MFFTAAQNIFIVLMMQAYGKVKQKN